MISLSDFEVRVLPALKLSGNFKLICMIWNSFKVKIRSLIISLKSWEKLKISRSYVSRLEKKSIDLVKKVFNKIENKPIVIDADALNIIAKNKLTVPKNSIITPHPLEAARLLCVDLDTVLNDLENSAKQLAKKYKCIVVLKNQRTIICDIDKYYVNQCGNSALAKAGTGDVLAGIIAGLIAQKMDLFEAAKLGVYLHARSGEIASEEYSEFSVLASELPFFVHKAIKELI